MKFRRSSQLAAFLILTSTGSALLSAAQVATPTTVVPQTTATPQSGLAETPKELPVTKAFEGTLADGISRVRELARRDDLTAAREVADALLAPRGIARTRLEWWNEGGDFVRALLDSTSSWTEPLGWNGRPESERARVRIERGLISLAPQERQDAERDFGRALALAPAGELREMAAYDLALLPLLTGEEWRTQIPELGGPPPAPQAPTAQGAPAEVPPDPLAQAKAAYLEARVRFIERLKLDWRDADTRANVELIQRRLRELAAIEQQREDQQQQQQDQQQEGDEQDQQDQNSESQDQQDQSDPQQPEENEQDSEAGEDEQQPEEQSEGDESEDQSQNEGEEPQAAEPQEVHLSQEELQRLLNRLAEHEKEAEALRELRNQRGSKGVDKDW